MNWTWQVRCQNKRFGLSKLVFAKPWNKPSYIDKKPILARQLNDWTMKTYWNYDVLCSHIANLFIHGGEEHICWTIREYKQKNRSKERLFQEYGWGNRTRTYEWINLLYASIKRHSFSTFSLSNHLIVVLVLVIIDIARLILRFSKYKFA